MGRSEVAALVERRLHEAGQAAGYLVKAAGAPTTVYALKGKLYLSGSGWLLLSLPNGLIRGLFAALDVPGAELPLRDGKLTGHCSVMDADEVAKIGADRISERGKLFSYQLGAIQEVVPHGWDGVSRVWYCRLVAPELKSLRKSYGLTPLPHNNEHDFHATFAIRKTGVLSAGETSKAAADQTLSWLFAGTSGGGVPQANRPCKRAGIALQDVYQDAGSPANATYKEAMQWLSAYAPDFTVQQTGGPSVRHGVTVQAVHEQEAARLGREKQGYAAVQGECSGVYATMAGQERGSVQRLPGDVQSVDGAQGRENAISSDAAWCCGSPEGCKEATTVEEGRHGNIHEGYGGSTSRSLSGPMLHHGRDERSAQTTHGPIPSRRSCGTAEKRGSTDVRQRMPVDNRAELSEGFDWLGVLLAGAAAQNAPPPREGEAYLRGTQASLKAAREFVPGEDWPEKDAADKSHRHFRMLCHCGAVVAQCRCPITEDEMRTFTTGRPCPACREKAAALSREVADLLQLP